MAPKSHKYNIGFAPPRCSSFRRPPRPPVAQKVSSVLFCSSSAPSPFCSNMSDGRTDADDAANSIMSARSAVARSLRSLTHCVFGRKPKREAPKVRDKSAICANIKAQSLRPVFHINYCKFECCQLFAASGVTACIQSP